MRAFPLKIKDKIKKISSPKFVSSPRSRVGRFVPEFIDHETGGKSHRVEFQTMFEADSQRKFDLLLFLGFGPALA
jgi:hypothetical protein